MTENQLKRSAGLYMILVHMVSVGLVLMVFFLGGFVFEQMTTAVAIIAPMFAGITAQVIIYFTNTRLASVDSSSRVTFEYMIVVFLFPSILGVLIWISTWSQANSVVFANFEQYKTALVFFEGLFAAYSARTMTALFGPIPHAKGAKKPGDGTLTK